MVGGVLLVLAGSSGLFFPGPGPAPQPGPDGEEGPAWPGRGGPGDPGPGGYLFCFWNVENLFDDQDDQRHTRGDKEYDGWFANNRQALQRKLDNLAAVLAPLNGGKG